LRFAATFGNDWNTKIRELGFYRDYLIGFPSGLHYDNSFANTSLGTVGEGHD